MSSYAGTAALRPAPVLPAALAAFTLAVLLGLQPLATDMILPALPLLARDLHAPMPSVQQTMSVLILAFGLAQLVWGPVADRVGRRPVLLAGLGLFTAASFWAAWAPTIGAVIAARAVQGAAMSAAVVCARAMVRDLYPPHQGALVMARALTGLGVMAIAAPVLGGALAHALGWRANLGVLGAIALALLVFVARRVPETAPLPAPHPAQAGRLWRQLGDIARHPGFRSWAMLVSCTYGGLFIYLASSGFVLIETLGLPAWVAGLALAASSASYIAGTYWCRWLLPRHGLAGACARAAWPTLAGGVLLAALALARVQAAWAVLLPIMLYTFGHGVHQSCGQAGAVAAFPQAAGTASALAGFLLAFVAFLVGQWLGLAMDGSTRPVALGVGLFAVLTALVAWTAVRRHGEPPADAA